MNILTDIAEAGWLVYNLSQDREGTWLAELWSPQDDGSWLITGSLWGFDTAEEALTAAFAETDKAVVKAKYVIEPFIADKPSTLLAQLGLLKPKAPILRRV